MTEHRTLNSTTPKRFADAAQCTEMPTRPGLRPYVIQSAVVTAFAAGGRECIPRIFGIGVTL